LFIKLFFHLRLQLHGKHTRMVLDATPHRFRGDRDARTPAPGRSRRGEPGSPADAGVTVSAPAPGSHAESLRQVMGGGWPLRSHLELGALAGAVPCARLHARQVLWEWGLPGLSENAQLLVSELVTNAIQASPRHDQILPVHLWLFSDRSRLLIQVQDTNPDAPAPTGADDEDEGGRGLAIVAAVSAAWGWHPAAGHRGKIVWALLEKY
jgi:anti-sigma regulatory factor (Ser/Thr protein kinase)